MTKEISLPLGCIVVMSWFDLFGHVHWLINIGLVAKNINTFSLYLIISFSLYNTNRDQISPNYQRYVTSFLSILDPHVGVLI